MSEDELSRAGEYLRLALPLMAKHRVPVTPRNYEIWYSYVAGTHPQLSRALDARLDAGTGLDETVLGDLYREHIANSDAKLAEQIRQALRKILASTISAFSDASLELGHFDEALQDVTSRISPGVGADELHRLVQNLSTETRSVQEHGARLLEEFSESQREVETLRKELQAARRAAETDALTGLYNRGAFNRILEEFCADGTNRSLNIGLLLIDIDHFKRVNDSHGHLVGDKVIQFLAKTLRDSVKGKDVVARFGGEEFAVILPDTTNDGCIAVAETIRKAMETARLVKSETKESLGAITVSVGVANHQNGDASASLIDRADRALFQSKHGGRNRVSADPPAVSRGLARAG